MNSTVSYVTIMYRYGSLENHSYIVYIGLDKDKAIAAANSEESLRGGKYTARIECMTDGDESTKQVIQWTPNTYSDKTSRAAARLWDSTTDLLTDEQIRRLEKLHKDDLQVLGIVR